LIFLPVIIFLCTGLGDVMMKFTEQLNTGQDMTLMISFIYFVALVFGLILVCIDYAKGKTTFLWKNIIGGIGLGLVNYFSTYCMYQCMRLFENVYLFPIYNIGVVFSTTLIGLFVFKEKLSKKNIIGLCLAVISVIIITFK
jgi:EamA-like transporter family.